MTSFAKPVDLEPVLQVNRLSKTFAARVVDEVNLVVRPGVVHALLGGNGSGKSTLLKMLAGVVLPDPGGTIEVAGTVHASQEYSATVAQAAGFCFVHQDLGMVDQLSIAENFGLARGFPRRGGLVSASRLRELTKTSLRQAGLDFDPDRRVGSLRPSERTLVAIARTLRDARDGEQLTLFLDEPTASLPIDEVEHLLDSLRGYRDDGHAIVFVSHRLSEVTAIADDVTVLRDGRIVGGGPIDDFPPSKMVEMIAGHHRDVPQHVRAMQPTGDPLLRVSRLNSGPLRDVTFDVHRGEILGIGGLVGSGRSSLLRALFGDQPSEGVIELQGKRLHLASPKEAISAGIALVPEDRIREAAFLDRPVWENLAAAQLLAPRSPLGSGRAQRRAAPESIRRFGIRTLDALVPLASLSGGNQQKVVMGRWLQNAPTLLLLDEPSQGVDAVARDEIHRMVRETAAAGAAVIVVSSDVEELEQLSDRVLVLADGQATAFLSGDDVARESITALMQRTGASS